MKTKLLFIVMAFHILNLSAAVSALSGNGTATDPYLISSVEELKWMRDQVNDLDKANYASATYKLMADLDFTDENDWIPIGDQEIPFKGVFQGNDKRIKNIKIGSEDNPVDIVWVGLFGFTNNATIKNLGVEWGESYSAHYSGGIVGYMEGGSICNSYSTGDISGFGYLCPSGGIVGYINNGSISNNYSTGDISNSCSGGIAGGMSNGNICNSYSTGKVYSSSPEANSGGIVGSLSNGNISNSYSTGDISNLYSGGIVGSMSNGNISNSYSTGNISSFSPFPCSYFCSGGIVGSMDNGSILNSYSSGNITSFLPSSYSSTNSSTEFYSGGIVGYLKKGSIRNCIALNSFIYAINKDTDNCFAGRIVGGTVPENTNVKIESNYASSDLVLAIGISSDELTPVTDFSGDKNGEELNEKPVNVLNNYMTGKRYSDEGMLFYSWRVDQALNQGNPVLDYSSPAMEFTLEGSGSETNPFLIYTNEDLIRVTVFVNSYPNEYTNKFYQLMSDLDFTGENDWIPIGRKISFKGAFDGNGKTIKNIKIGSEDNPANMNSVSLFGYIENAIIENLGVEWKGLFSSNYSGGIAGSMNRGTIRNSYSSGIISGPYSGGIVGYMNTGTICDSYSSATMSSFCFPDNKRNYYSGGIVALMDNGNIINSYATGTISSNFSSRNSYSGGIAGYMSAGTISNSYTTGTVYSSSSSSNSGSYSGGIVGSMSDGNIYNSYSSGDISSSNSGDYNSYSGGIAGYMNSVNGNIINTYASGNISSNSDNSNSYSGGIIGHVIYGNVRNNIALNSFIYAFNKQTEKCFVGKITGGSSDIKIESNYASNNIAVAIGISSDQLTPVTDFSDNKNGEELNSKPVTILNNYVTEKKYSDTGTLLCPWIVENEVNQGNPILDHSSQTMQFTLEGSGSETNPFLIYTNEDLIKVSIFVNTYPDEYSNKFYTLMADLDFTGENDWTPIGINNPFKGVFNGNDNAIKNIKIGNENKPATIDWVGLFGRTENAIIENLRVEWSGLYSSSYCGGIVGYMNNGSIQNSSSSANIHSSAEYQSYCGGIVGFMNIDGDNGSIRNSSSSANISASPKSMSFCGGIVGYMKNDRGIHSGIIQDSYSSGNISPLSYTSSSGGIIGYIDSNKSIIQNCYSSGDISASSSSGGIVGYLGGHKGIISNCYSSGNISVSYDAVSMIYSGGIVGFMNSEGGFITNSYSSGNISASSLNESFSYSFSGGIAGYLISGNVTSCISLNPNITSICSSSKDYAFAGRVAVHIQDGTLSSNYAAENVSVKTGTSESDLSAIDPVGENHGDNLNDTPLNLLNNWVTNNTTPETPYLTWCVLESVNNGNPVFAAFTILTVTFQTTEAMPETSVQATYGALLTKPIDPVCEGFDFAGWYKDPEYKQAWDFDADRVTDHITLYAKWEIADSIEELNSDHLVIYSGTAEIVVKNAASGITIYNTAGALIKTIQQPGSVEHIGVEAGYYILKTDGVSKKVIVY